jgi:hypothetical protein
MSRPDVSTAEWIVEAPSACDSSGQQCEQLPVSNFGSEAFSHARASTVAGHRGTITDSAWSAIQIQLSQDGNLQRPRFADTASTAGATPSALAGTGSSFTVAYSESAPAAGQTPQTLTPASGGPWSGVFAAG